MRSRCSKSMVSIRCVTVLSLVLVLASSLALADVCNKSSVNWPDCLINPLNGTYFIRSVSQQVWLNDLSTHACYVV